MTEEQVGESDAEPETVTDSSVDTETESDDSEPQNLDESDSTTDSDPDTTESTDGLQHGDFVKLDYTARTSEDGRLVDTTDPEIAADEGVDDEQETFEPRTIVLGEGHLFEAVEASIVGSEVGDTGTITVPAVDAFGEYEPEDVETISADKIDEDNRYPGGHVTIGGQHGHITTIIGSRARVDFNHPLAGEDIEYEYEIIGVVEDREERATGLFETYLDVEPTLWIQTDQVEEEVLVEDEDDSATDDDDSAGVENEDDEDESDDSGPATETVTVDKETLYVESTPMMTMNQQWMMMKNQIAQEIIDKVGVDRIIVQEVLDGMGGMGGMGFPGAMGGMGEESDVDIESALEDADVDADEIVEELETDLDEE